VLECGEKPDADVQAARSVVPAVAASARTIGRRENTSTGAFRPPWWPSCCGTRHRPGEERLNTILFLVTPGREISKAGTLIITLVDFKTAFDDSAPLQRLQFRSEHFPEIVLSPQDATRLFTANQIDYVPIDEAHGRIAATLALVYPPGIGVVVPGERWDERAAPMIAYLKLFEESYAHFPGFENEIQGVYPEKGKDGRVRLFTYVIRE
jgi:ornithine decarboxylase